jgi:hypothetical protein
VIGQLGHSDRKQGEGKAAPPAGLHEGKRPNEPDSGESEGVKNFFFSKTFPNKFSN